MTEQRTLWIPDCHAPYHHKKSMASVLEYMADTRWDTVVQMGDFYDIRAANHHRLDNRKLMENERLGRELAAGKQVWAQVVRAARAKNAACRIVVTSGNHEAFLLKYISFHPELEDVLPTIPSLFEGADKVIPYSNRALAFRIGKLHSLHGYASSVARNAVRKYLNDFGCNLVCGHHHGIAQDSKSSKDGVISCWCFGYLGDPSVGDDYLAGPDNWQHGFGESFHRPDGSFNVYPTVIVNGKFTAISGRTYGRR